MIGVSPTGVKERAIGHPVAFMTEWTFELGLRGPRLTSLDIAVCKEDGCLSWLVLLLAPCCNL